MEIGKIREILMAYLDGRMSPSEKDAIGRLVNEDDVWAREFARLKKMVKSYENIRPFSASTDFQSGIMRAIQGEPRPLRQKGHSPALVYALWASLTAAAVLLVLALNNAPQRPGPGFTRGGEKFYFSNQEAKFLEGKIRMVGVLGDSVIMDLVNEGGQKTYKKGDKIFDRYTVSSIDSSGKVCLKTETGSEVWLKMKGSGQTQIDEVLPSEKRAVRGRVTDSQGKGIANADVSLVGVPFKGEPEQGNAFSQYYVLSGLFSADSGDVFINDDNKVVVGEIRTDKDGNYKFDDVDEKFIGFIVTAEHDKFAKGRSRQFGIPVEREIVLSDITLLRSAVLSGRVTDNKGRALAAVKLQVQNQSLGGSLVPGNNSQMPDMSNIFFKVLRGNSGAYYSEMKDWLWETDKDGRFEFTPGITGAFVLLAGSEDYHVSYTSLDLGEGEMKKDINIELAPAAKITGTLLDKTGNALKESRVTCVAVNKPKDENKFSVGNFYGKVDEQGFYVIRGLNPGEEYTVSAYAPLCKVPEAVLLKAGSTKDFVLEKLPLVDVAISVVSEGAKKPIAGADVNFSSGVNNQSVKTDEKGGCIVQVPVAEYNVRVSSANFLGKSVTVNVQEGLTKQVFALSEGGVIEGRVTDSFGKPLENAEVFVSRHSEDVKNQIRVGASLRFFDGESGAFFAYTMFSHEMAYTNEKGEFRIAGLEDADYKVVADHKEYCRKEYEKIVVIKNQSTEKGVNLDLTTGGKVKGSVLDSQGRPQMGAKVFIDTGDDKLQTQSGPKGEYVFEHVAKGKYAIYYGNNIGRKDIEVDEGKIHEVDISPNGYKIFGRLKLDKEFAGKKISLHFHRLSDNLEISVESDQEGNFVIEELCAGDWEVTGILLEEEFSHSFSSDNLKLPSGNGTLDRQMVMTLKSKEKIEINRIDVHVEK